LWRQSIDSNRAAHTAALAYVQQTFGPDSFDSETVHTMDYLVYAYLQTSQDQQATAIVDELLAFRRSAGANLPAAYAVAAIPVRLVLEHRDWPAAAALGAPAVGFPLERFPWAEAMISFARALGSARTGDISSAQVEIARLQTLKDQLSAANDAYWANQVEVERLAASGVLAHAQGDDRTALALTRAAADLDATMDKHPATPAPVLPARELLADVLLEVNQPREALNEYELSLRTEPNRFRSILGKARAARQLGDLSLSRDAYQSLVILSTQAPSQRPEVLEAEAFLAN
jgi:tetratricopeptide (TPR) repeat protein